MTRPQILSKLIAHNFEISLKSFKNTHSSNQWLERHHRDPYVKRAVKETYRARSAFKLIEINDKYKFIHPGDVVVDLGASPGSWSQVAIKLTNSEGMDPKNPKGIVASVDRDFIEPLGPGAKVFSHSDITDTKTFEKVKEALEGKKANSILSDMAPNCTGQTGFDHDAIVELQKLAFGIAKMLLIENGHFLCKIWFGDRTQEFRDELLRHFKTVKLVKPKASRNESSEIFLYCADFKS